MQLVYRFGLYSVLGSIALMSLLVLPAMIGVLVDESALSEFQAGWAASIHFLGGALIALTMAFHMHGLDLRRVSIAAFLLAAAGDVLSGFTADHAVVFLMVRFATGLGTGAAYTAAVASFARERHVDRGYGLFITLQFIISGLGLFFLPVYSAFLGVTGMFLVFATLDLAGAVLSRYLPGRATTPSVGRSGKTELHILLGKAVLFGTLGFAIYEAANTAQFTYIERYGSALELSSQQLGSALMIGSLAGIPGAFSIILIGTRFGRKGPLAFGVAVAIAGLLILIGTEQLAYYMLGSVLLGFSWAFCLPFIQGLLASLDPNGSAVAAGSASSTIGGAIGPGLAAVVVGDGNYHRVFLFAIALLLTSLVSFFLAGERPERSQTGET
jgi:MFS family permease